MSSKTLQVAAGDFKNRCLSIMDEVNREGVPVTVTKRGKPLVRIVPAREPTKLDDLRGTIVRQAKDIFSTGERWEAED